MKITLCASIAFMEKMLKIKKQLETQGHEVKLPPTYIKDENGNSLHVKKYYTIRKNAAASETWVWDKKQEAILTHYKKIAWADAILVLNYEKNNIPGYVGANTLMEIGLALYLDKKIYLFNEIPEISYKEEILGTKPIILNGNLRKIT